MKVRLEINIVIRAYLTRRLADCRLAKGKHAGKNFIDVYNTDKGYVHYVLGNKDRHQNCSWVAFAKFCKERKLEEDRLRKRT